MTTRNAGAGLQASGFRNDAQGHPAQGRRFCRYLSVVGGPLSVALALMLAAASACAQEVRVREGMWSESLDAALNAARYSGRPVLVFFSADWCGYCEKMEAVLAHREVRDATRRFVLVKLKLEENAEAAARYRVDMHHSIVMLDWSWNVLGRVREFKSERDVAEQVIEAAARNDLSAGEKLLELDYYRKAAERLAGVIMLKRPADAVEKAKSLLESIRGRCERALADAKKLAADRRTDDAIAACRDIIENFPEDMGVAEARILLKKLIAGEVIEPEKKEAPDVDAVPTDADEQTAKRLLERGMVDEWDKRYLDAVDTYHRIVREFGKTAAAGEAKTRRDLLLKDPAIMKVIVEQKREQDCARWLEMGRLYEENGRTDLAIPYYNALLTKYPDHPAARIARERLDDIERKFPEK